MTCDEYKKHVHTDPLQVTRGVRASVLRHMDTCKSCFEYTRLHAEKTPLSAEELSQIDEVHSKDLLDREYREVVWGGKKK